MSQPRIRIGVIVQVENRILMVEHRKGDRSYWLLPGGGLDADLPIEEAEAAAQTAVKGHVVPVAIREIHTEQCVLIPAHAFDVCPDAPGAMIDPVHAEILALPARADASAEDLAAVSDSLLPGILKTARMGYDGKGQVRVKSREELSAAWAGLKNVTCVLEQMLPLALELSVLVVRGADGAVVTFPVQQNLHRDGILAVTEVPAPDVDAALQAQARQSAAAIASGMGYVGVLCVEFFVLKDGRLVVNEMAPRPHNSGHYTIETWGVHPAAAR